MARKVEIIKDETKKTYRGAMRLVGVRVHDENIPSYELYAEVKRYGRGNWWGFIEANYFTGDSWDTFTVINPDENELFDEWRYTTSKSASDFVKSLAAAMIEHYVNFSLNEYPPQGGQQIISLCAHAVTDVTHY